MYDTILIPYDGTDEARRGAKHGIELAAAVDASIHALYVVDLPGAPRALSLRDDEESMREEYHAYGEEVTSDVCTMAGEAGVECEGVIRSGAPAEEIVEYAEESGIDAIVMGSSYQGKFPNLLGTTSERVVRTSTVPVVTTRMTVND
jgi:nucleotide-binding universal stress UspA family protein